MCERILSINQTELQSAAEIYLDRACGLHKENQKNKTIRRKVYALHDAVAGSLVIRALIVPLKRMYAGRDCINIHGKHFPCHFLIEIAPESLKALYAFVLTVGEVPAAGTSMAAALYADMWATAYISAASDAVREILSRESKAYIPDGVAGPGYHGMSVSKLRDLFEIVDGSLIGVSLNGDMMEPLKSIAGFYLGFSKEAAAALSGNPCLNCESSGYGCEFCKFYSQR